ncbi:L7Ae/L30e/S12e/Gadd45 family ribosomal protein [Terrisporobacter sp.]
MNNNIEKIHSLLGLAMRAGKLVSGEDGTMLDLKKGKLNLIIVAEDASNNTKKLFKDKSSFRKVDYIELSTKNDLGVSIGKDSRAVIGIKDIGFANKIVQLMN